MKKKNLFIVLLCVFALIYTSVAPMIFQGKINKLLESIDTENLWQITVTESSDGNKINLKSGSYVYEVTASFSGSSWGRHSSLRILC